MIRSYRELCFHKTFEERFEYLSLKGAVGSSTFGYDRYLNQRFYSSREWKSTRDYVILRDNGCDLGIQGYEIHSRLLIHHINPMRLEHISTKDDSILDPEYLITTTHQTHNAIHFGDASLLPKKLVERRRGDTRLW